MTAQEAFDDHFDDCLSLAKTSEALGVPGIQLARWCADGSIPETAYRGHPMFPGRLRFRREWIDGDGRRMGQARG